jgi:hypothetical protein
MRYDIASGGEEVGRTPSSAFWSRRECGVGRVVYVGKSRSWK